MMKVWISLLLLMGVLHGWSAETADPKSSIGPTMNAPVGYLDSIVFLATSGVLYKSDVAITQMSKLFQTKKSSVCPLQLDGAVAYFGEGLHDDTSSHFYAFDLAQSKLLYEVELPGHVERAPLVTETRLYVGLGPGGLAAIDKKTRAIIWRKDRIDQGALHVDSTPVRFGNDVCVTSIYAFKGVVCFSEQNENLTLAIALKRNPKSDIQVAGPYLIGMAMDADMMTPKWDIPSEFYVIDVAAKKKVASKELRGYQFYSSREVSARERFVAISTGDLLLLKLPSGDITFIGEMGEPITSPPFFMNNLYCAISVKGKLRCYKRLENKFELIQEQAMSQTVIGNIGTIKGKTYLPGRLGYTIL